MNLTDEKGKIKFIYIFFLVRNIVVFYWLNRLNWLKNQVLCGVAGFYYRLNCGAVAVKLVKNGGFLRFFDFCGFVRCFFVKFFVPGMRSGLAANRCLLG